MTRIVQLALALALLMLAPAVVWAHAALVSSEPGRRSKLQEAPLQLRLCFSEAVEEKFSSVELTDEDDQAVAVPSPKVDPQRARCLQLALPSLANGRYTVKYRVLSVDGHVVDYGYQFDVNASEN